MVRRFLRSGVMRTATSLGLDEFRLRRLRSRVSGGNPVVQVIAMHETLPVDASRLRKQLEWAGERFTPISPESLFELLDQARTPRWSKPAVLFTFDDGRQSNYHIAAPLLESMGVRGLFFVVPEFVGLSGREARDFYYGRIDTRNLEQSEFAGHWTPMTREQITDLARRGHAIGNHTLSHTSLAGLSPAELHRQIESSAERISSWIGKQVEAFAWPYAWNAINREALACIRQTHRFCFAPCPGTMDCAEDSPHLIWRTEAEAYYSDSEYRFMYSGLVNPGWARQRKQLRALLKN
jgi:peptidoglycan/xylan/chitin deacetylase (PgdA/CDA1 family)